MKQRSLSNVSLIMIMVLIASRSADAQRHAFTVADDIAMSRFSEPAARPGIVGTDVALKSPDGKYAVVITTRGVLSTDRIISSIYLFNLHDAIGFLYSKVNRRPPPPRLIATLSSFPHHQEPIAYAPVMTDLRWTDDSSRVYFLGEDLSGVSRIYQAMIDGGAAQVLTPPGYIVTQFADAGNTIVYRAINVAMENDRDAGGERINRDARDVTGERLHAILLPHDIGVATPSTSAVWITRKDKARQSYSRIPHSSVRDRTQFWAMYTSEETGDYTPFSLSPNGRGLIELSPVPNIPSAWESYEPAKGFEHMRYHTGDPLLTSDTNVYRPKRYTLLDLGTGVVRPLIDAPNALTLGYNASNRVIWSADGRRALVTNTFIPLGHIVGGVAAERRSPCAVAVAELQSREVSCLLFSTGSVGADNIGRVHDVTGLLFGDDGNEITVHADLGQRKDQLLSFRYGSGQWRLIAAEHGDESAASSLTGKAACNDDVQLVVRQSLNDPPTLWVVSKRSGQGKQMWDPNPQLAQIEFGQASVYQWKDRSGYLWTGGLIRPVGYVAGRRYPLVIQMYMFYDGQFITDGTDPTAFAARELASAGFVVLQIQKKSVHTFNDAEAQEHLEGYRSAIDHLSRDGLIDPHKVGVVGFSWTCWYVENALIKAPHMFAAATIADGVDHSYMNYHLFDFTSPILREQDDRIIGGHPVGEGLTRWLQVAPDFHLDQVRTPLRIEAIGGLSILSEWEIYSSLEMESKPVDLIYFPTGTHIHQKPLERLESQQGDVDWMRFWLQNYEDPDPGETSQYQRWEKLRQLRFAEDKKSTPN